MTFSCTLSPHAEHCWEAHGTHCYQETHQRPWGQKDTPCKSGGSNQESAHEKMQLHFHMCTEDSRGKNKQWLWQLISRMLTRVQFKLLLDLLIQYGISLTLTRWAAGTPWKRTVVMKLGNWSSAPHQFTMGLPQRSPLSPVFFNVYTKGLADLNQNGPSKILTLADDRLIKIYKTSKDFQEVAEAVQQLDSVSKRCHDTRSLLNPDKAQTLYLNQFWLLYETLLPENLGKHCQKWPAGKTELEMLEIKFLIQENGKMQDLIVSTDGSVTKDQSGWSFMSSKVQLPSMKTVQPIQSQPPAWQWRWKQLPMPSAGLPQEVTVRPHLPSSSQIQWACYKVKSGMGSPDWNVSMVDLHLWNLLWVYCPGHAGVKGNYQAGRLAG